MTSIGPDNALPRFQKQSGPKVLNYFGVSDEMGQSRPGCMGCSRFAYGWSKEFGFRNFVENRPVR
jgi:hypothetical protein